MTQSFKRTDIKLGGVDITRYTTVHDKKFQKDRHQTVGRVDISLGTQLYNDTKFQKDRHKTVGGVDITRYTSVQ